MNPTSEQSAILSIASGTEANFLINALAGTGKTTTLEMIEHAVKARPILYLAFNKKIAEDAKKRMLSTTTVKTFNSLGHGIWAKSCAKTLSLDARKTQTLMRGLIDETPRKDQAPLWEAFWPVVAGVALAKALGYVPEGKFPNARRLCTQNEFHTSLEEAPDDLTSDLIDAILTRSIQTAYQGNVDYNDQIYMPALFGGTFPRFPLTMVDEAQDMSPVNHALLERVAKLRLVAVGDPWQNIYGFRGAKQGGMQELKAKYKMMETDLSVSFRCPQAVVEAARWRVPHFKWIKEGGHVESLLRLDVSDIDDSAVVICRNNAPLFRCAINLLACGRSVSVSGSDIGPKLIAIMKKLGDSEMSQASLLSAIDDWLAEKLDRGNKTAQDLADCMKVFAKFGSTLSGSIAYAEHLFAQKGTIRLLTGHKAKGLEWDTVYHLDPWLCREDEQDQNLRYVITTRSADTLFEINSDQIQW